MQITALVSDVPELKILFLRQMFPGVQGKIEKNKP
jgi:hypothetical protein